MRFDSYHPMINLIFFVSATVCTAAFTHPAYVAISYAAAFIYSVCLGRGKALIFDLCLIPLVILYVAVYSYYNHFGVTVICENIIENRITMEAVVYGAVIGARTATVIMWLSCLFRVFSADKITYIFGRLSPHLSLFISIILRSVPRIRERAHYIGISRSAIGRGIGEGNIFRRILNAVNIASVTITWSMQSFIESSCSMKARGYMLKGRTAYSIYRFDNRDRSVVMVMLVCVMLTVMAFMFDQTYIYYDPQIIMNRITPLSYVFYAAYAGLLMLPVVLQAAGEVKMRHSLSGNEF